MSSEEETPEMTLPSSLSPCRHTENRGPVDRAVCPPRSHVLSPQSPVSSHPERLVWGGHPKRPGRPPFLPETSVKTQGDARGLPRDRSSQKSEPCFFPVLPASSRQEKSLAASKKRGQRETFPNAVRVVTCGCLKKKKSGKISGKTQSQAQSE